MTREQAIEDIKLRGLRLASQSEAGWYVVYSLDSGRTSFWVTDFERVEN